MTLIEIKIIEFLRNLATGFLDNFFIAITFLGSQEVLIVLIIFVYFIYSKKSGQLLALTAFLSLSINNILKSIILRPRPWLHPNAHFKPRAISSATGASFPSGHTQNSAVLYSTLALEVRKENISIVVGILIALIGFSRIYLGVHYPSDVIVGIIIGTGCAFLGFHIYHLFEYSFKNIYLIHLILIGLTFPFLFIFWRKSYEDIYIYRDFFTSFALLVGYSIAISIENKFVNFTNKTNLVIKVVRSAIAIVIAAATMFGFKVVFPDKNIIFDMLRYFLIPIFTLGLYPILFKSILFTEPIS